jgi:hypothetical protein
MYTLQYFVEVLLVFCFTVIYVTAQLNKGLTQRSITSYSIDTESDMVGFHCRGAQARFLSRNNYKKAASGEKETRKCQISKPTENN